MNTYAILSYLLLAMVTMTSWGQSESLLSGSTSENVIQVSLFDPIQIHPSDTSVRGARLTLLYGKNHHLTGIDYGFVNVLTGDMDGYQTGIWNQVNGDTLGLQYGFVNITRGTMTGLQIGGVNLSGEHHGLQAGLWNQTEDLNGLQIGLVNLNGNKEPFGFLPIVNWNF